MDAWLYYDGHEQMHMRQLQLQRDHQILQKMIGLRHSPIKKKKTIQMFVSHLSTSYCLMSNHRQEFVFMS